MGVMKLFRDNMFAMQMVMMSMALPSLAQDGPAGARIESLSQRRAANIEQANNDRRAGKAYEGPMCQRPPSVYVANKEEVEAIFNARVKRTPGCALVEDAFAQKLPLYFNEDKVDGKIKFKKTENKDGTIQTEIIVKKGKKDTAAYVKAVGFDAIQYTTKMKGYDGSLTMGEVQKMDIEYRDAKGTIWNYHLEPAEDRKSFVLLTYNKDGLPVEVDATGKEFWLDDFEYPTNNTESTFAANMDWSSDTTTKQPVKVLPAAAEDEGADFKPIDKAIQLWRVIELHQALRNPKKIGLAPPKVK
jgi:hypothetical protein